MFQKSASPAVQKKKKSSKKSSEKMQTEVEHQKDNNMTVKQMDFMHMKQIRNLMYDQFLFPHDIFNIKKCT